MESLIFDMCLVFVINLCVKKLAEMPLIMLLLPVLALCGLNRKYEEEKELNNPMTLVKRNVRQKEANFAILSEAKCLEGRQEESKTLYMPQKDRQLEENDTAPFYQDLDEIRKRLNYLEDKLKDKGIQEESEKVITTTSHSHLQRSLPTGHLLSASPEMAPLPIPISPIGPTSPDNGNTCALEKVRTDKNADVEEILKSSSRLEDQKKIDAERCKQDVEADEEKLGLEEATKLKVRFIINKKRKQVEDSSFSSIDLKINPAILKKYLTELKKETLEEKEKRINEKIKDFKRREAKFLEEKHKWKLDKIRFEGHRDIVEIRERDMKEREEKMKRTFYEEKNQLLSFRHRVDLEKQAVQYERQFVQKDMKYFEEMKKVFEKNSEIMKVKFWLETFTNFLVLLRILYNIGLGRCWKKFVEPVLKVL